MRTVAQVDADLDATRARRAQVEREWLETRPLADRASGVDHPTVTKLAALAAQLRWPELQREAVEVETTLEKLIEERKALRAAEVEALEAELRRDLRPMLKALSAAAEAFEAANLAVVQRVQQYEAASGRGLPVTLHFIGFSGSEAMGASEVRESQVDLWKRALRNEGYL